MACDNFSKISEKLFSENCLSIIIDNLCGQLDHVGDHIGDIRFSCCSSYEASFDASM